MDIGSYVNFSVLNISTNEVVELYGLIVLIHKDNTLDIWEENTGEMYRNQSPDNIRVVQLNLDGEY